MAITDEMRTAILELYTAYFNRAADTDGVNYWLNEMDTKGWTVDTVAQSFADQTEYSTIYSGLSNTQITEKIYTNILGRSADAAGLAYWVAELDAQTLEVKNLVQAVVNAATEVVGGTAVNTADKSIVDNKTEVSRYYYDNKQNETGVSLASVTGDSATVTTAKTTADVTIETNAVATYNTALATYNTAVTTAAASKAAADTAALTVSTTALANASLTAANTANTDATAVVTAATALVTAAAATNSTSDDTLAATYKSTADSSATTALTLVSTATTAVSAATAAEAETTAATTSTTATLTTEIDNLTGDSSNNLFIGDANSTVTADQIDGGAGTDIFRLYDGASTADMPTLSNVEQIELVRFDTVDLDLSSVSALELLTLDDSENGRTYTVADNVSSVIKNMVNGEAVTVAYAATETEATSTLDALGSTGGVVTTNIDGTGLTTINLVSSGTGSFVDLDSSGTITTLNVSGTKALSLNTSTETAISTLNASAMTAGGLTLTLGAPTTTIALTGSASDDTITLGAALTSSDSLNAGNGTDTLLLASAAAATVAGDSTISSKVTNFEKLRITDDLVSTFDISKFSGINYLILADDVAGGGATISGLTSGATIEFLDASAPMTNVLTVSIANATDTGNTSDVLNLKANADINGASATYKVDVAGIETINFEATDSDLSSGVISDGYVATLSTDTSLKTLNITGSREFSYTTTTAVLLETIDASSVTGEVIIDASGVAGVAKTITGGTKNDTLTGSTVVDTINAGAGNDVIDGKAGNDIFIISSASESKGDTYDGDAGTGDTLKIKSTAVGSGGITQNLIDFTTPTNTILDNLDFTQAAAFANIENIDASEVTNSMKIIGETAVVNTITTGTASDIIELKAGGAANVVVITATNSIDGKEDQILDFVKNTDILRFTGDHGTNKIELNALTVTDNGDSAGNTFQYTDLGLADIILDTGNIGSADDLTGSAQLGDASTVNTTNEVTFTSNATTIVAGTKADYIVGGTAKQTISLGAGNDVFLSAVGGSNDGSEDQFEDFASGADLLILTGANTAALDLGVIVEAQVGATAYYEKTLGTSHVIFKFSDTDMADSIQLGTTSAAFSSTANITAGDKADVVQSGSSNQTFDLGAGNDIMFYNSATTDATGVAESITGGTGTDTLIVAGGTTAVNFSDDTIATFNTLELTKDIAGTADTNAQSLTMTDAQVDLFTIVNSEHNGTTGDVITLSDAMTSDMLDTTVINGGLKLKLANTANSLTLVDATMDATTDSLVIDGSSMTGASALTFDGSLEATVGVTIIGGAGAEDITGTDKADTFTGGSGIDTYKGYNAGLGTSNAATAETFTNGGIANGDTVTFGNGVDTITDFASAVDKIDVTTAATAPTTLMNLAAGALTDGTTYTLLGTYTGGVFTVNSAATSSTTNVATLIVEGDGAQTETTSTNYLMLTGISAVVAGDFI